MRNPRGPFMRNDHVFFACTNPGTGWVKRVAKDQSWAEVEWQPDERIRYVKRYDTKYLRLLNPVLNDFLGKKERKSK